MSNPPRIWLDYRPVRIGWVIPNQDVARLVTDATWNSCLWGGRHNYVIPAHDTALADRHLRKQPDTGFTVSHSANNRCLRLEAGP